MEVYVSQYVSDFGDMPEGEVIGVYHKLDDAKKATEKKVIDILNQQRDDFPKESINILSKQGKLDAIWDNDTDNDQAVTALPVLADEDSGAAIGGLVLLATIYKMKIQ